jgi:serine/threonine protein kinase
MFTHEEGYSYKSDVFSLGALFFNLLTGRYLFSGENMEQTLRRNVRCDISGVGKYLLHTSNNCKDLLNWMLQSNPDKRPSAHEALTHPWFNHDKDIIRDLLLLNEVMCEETLGQPRMRKDSKNN